MNLVFCFFLGKKNDYINKKQLKKNNQETQSKNFRIGETWKFPYALRHPTQRRAFAGKPLAALNSSTCQMAFSSWCSEANGGSGPLVGGLVGVFQMSHILQKKHRFQIKTYVYLFRLLLLYRMSVPKCSLCFATHDPL